MGSLLVWSLVTALVAPGTLDAQTTRLKDLKIRGYVTSVVSATEFEIEDYRITRDTGFVIDLENPYPKTPQVQSRRHPDRRRARRSEALSMTRRES